MTPEELADLVKRLRNRWRSGAPDPICQQAADAIEQLSQPPAGYRWVPVSERMPEGDALLLTSSKMIVIGDWYKGAWRTARSTWERVDGTMVLKSAYRKDDITHWMPLPQTR
jgi:hypothetical protein